MIKETLKMAKFENKQQHNKNHLAIRHLYWHWRWAIYSIYYRFNYFLQSGPKKYAVSTFTPRSSHILISMSTHSPLLASRLAAGRRSASWAR